MTSHNIWDNIEDSPPKEYLDLHDYISFEGFEYDKYKEGETNLLTHRLEDAGYKAVQFLPGETDCFGPLTRTCRALDRNNNVVWFVYG